MVDLIVTALSEMIAVCMEALVDMVLPVFGFNFETFNRAFPFAATSYRIFQAVAVAIVLLLAAFQLLPFFANSARNRTSPLRIGFGAMIAVAGIYYGNYLLEGIIRIAQMPYNALMAASTEGQALSDIGLSATFAVVNDLLAGVSVLLYIILIIMIGIGFIKLLLEAVERYAVLFVLVYLSPLASSTLATDATSGIFKRFMSMFFAQCILLILNVWSLQMVVSLFDGLYNNANKVLALLLGYAFLRVAAKLDSYLNSIGLNAAITGAGLGSELMATGMMLLGGASRMAGNKSFSGASTGKGGTGGILGLGRSMAKGVRAVSPVAGAGAAAANTAKGFGSSVSQGFAAAKEARRQGKSGAGAFGKAFRDSIGNNMHDANMKTQGQNMVAGLFGGASARTANQFREGGTSLTDKHRADIAKHAHLADAAFANAAAGAPINDPATVGSVMKGIGISNIEDGENAVSASFGAIPVEDLNTSMDADGIAATYEHDGRSHSWSIKSATQYAAMSVQEQQGYESFKNDNGSTYYCKHTSSRAPSPAQKQEAEISSAITAFAADPVGSPMTAQQWSQSKQAGTRHLLNQMAEEFQANGTSLDYSEETKDSCRHMLSAWATTLTDCGVPKKAIKRAEMALLAHEDMSIKEFRCSGNGIHVVGEENGKEYEFGMMTVSGMEAHNVDYSNLRNKGYLPSEINGQDYFAFYSERDPEDDNVSRKFHREDI